MGAPAITKTKDMSTEQHLEWNVKVNWDLVPQKEAKLTITFPDGKVRSAKYVQGFYFGEDTKVINPGELEPMLWLLRQLSPK